jgi:acyl-CoA synthetase (AMP-forming)/AMP-acid ligase II
VILPLFSGYGPSAIVTRLADADAKALFTTDGLFRRGRTVPLKAVADGALAQVSSVEHVIVVNRCGLEDVPWQPGRDRWWHDLVPQQATTAETERTAAEDPLMIIYTSGTTGRPKGAVHTHCGFPVKAAQDLRHAMDLKPGNTLYWMSDMGWMMGPWMVFGALLNRATMLFYDGAPDFPDVDRLWALVEKHNITHLGISPTLIRALKPHGADPVRRGGARPVEILGFAQAHPGSDPLETMTSGAVCAGRRAFEMAGLRRADVDVAELYDCYTFTVLITLEDYGFCEKGEGGPFVASGATSRGGSLPTNTGGGQLSSFYMWGMTPIVEAVTQLRGDGGGRQIDGAEVALVSGNGGILATHSTLLLGRG